MRKLIWAIEAKEWHGIGLRHSVWVIFIIRHHPSFMHFEGILMYFEGNPLVIFITPLYYLSPQLVVVRWGHASEG